MKHNALPILAGIVLSVSVYGAEGKQERTSGSTSTSEEVSVSAEKVSEILRELEKPYVNIKSLSYNVARKRTTLNSETEDSWNFTYRAPSDLRVEYSSPQKRILIISARDMWEYLPDQRVAMHTDLAMKPKAEKDAVTAKVLARVSVSGLRPGNYDHLLSQVTSSRTAGDILTIKGDKSPKFVLKVDIEKNALLVSEIYDSAGRLKLKTTCADHELVQEGFWMPRRVESITSGNGQYVTDVVHVSEVSVDHDFRDEVFLFTKPENVQVVENPGKRK